MLYVLHGMPSEAYFATRYAVLRQPLGMPHGSERLSDDDDALHAWFEVDNAVAAVGRAHVLPIDSDGSALTTKDQVLPPSPVRPTCES